MPPEDLSRSARSRRRLAFVVQRYGCEVSGGAELACRLLAERLAAADSVDVLTTCALDYVSWKNHFRPGVDRLNNVTVRRFPVDFERDPERFQTLSGTVLGGPHTPQDEEEWMIAQGPYSSRLFAFVEEHAGDYDLFLFITYLYATTYFCLPAVAGKAVLIPTAHDERPIYLGIFDRVFALPRLVLTLTVEEMGFVQKRFGTPAERLALVGSGLDTSGIDDRDPAWFRFARRLPRERPRLLYVGRLDESKGCRLLFEHFERFRADRPEFDLQLLLAGRGPLAPPETPAIHAAGFVSNAFKFEMMRQSAVVVIPSALESLSLASLEAWAVGRPVLVNGRSPVLRGHCERSGGGLWFESYPEFREALSWLLSHPEEAGAMGGQGRRYVLANYSWPAVMDRLERELGRLCGGDGEGGERRLYGSRNGRG